MHTPVLLGPTIEVLEVKKDGLYIDATAGEGGHLKKILKLGGKVLAIDVDQEQIDNLRLTLRVDKGVIFEVGNFRDIEAIAKRYGFYPVDGIIFDLGLSMRQIRKSERGFSYNNPGEPLDMRLDQKQKITAADLINSLDAHNLYEIFSKNSEELDSRAIAEAIFSARHLKKIERVSDLLEVLEKLGARETTKARIFQALRMEVNNEKENLERGLGGGLRILKRGGRMVVITFHSVEDRWVKRFIKSYKEKIAESLLIKPEKEELTFARSAKLRIIVKK